MSLDFFKLEFSWLKDTSVRRCKLKFGAQATGVIVELWTEIWQNDGKPVEFDCDILAGELGASEDCVKYIVEQSGLFYTIDGFLGSESLEKRREEVANRGRRGGKASAKKRAAAAKKTAEGDNDAAEFPKNNVQESSSTVQENVQERSEKRSTIVQERSTNVNDRSISLLSTLNSSTLNSRGKGGLRGKRGDEPPDREFVLQFFSANYGTPDDAERFFNHYESTGWTINGTPLANWKAKAKNWIIAKRDQKKTSKIL